MKILPHYKEDEGAKCSGSISLLQNMNVLSEDEAKTIATYMESCSIIDEWLSNIKDPITGRLEIPSKTWADGEYVWDSSHIYYVRRYRVRLPNEFVKHVKERERYQFDAKTLDKAALRAEFECILRRLATGDESIYAVY